MSDDNDFVERHGLTYHCSVVYSFESWRPEKVRVEVDGSIWISGDKTEQFLADLRALVDQYRTK